MKSKCVVDKTRYVNETQIRCFILAHLQIGFPTFPWSQSLLEQAEKLQQKIQ